jgi:hypothetical protein
MWNVPPIRLGYLFKVKSDRISPAANSFLHDLAGQSRGRHSGLNSCNNSGRLAHKGVFQLLAVNNISSTPKFIGIGWVKIGIQRFLNAGFCQGFQRKKTIRQMFTAEPFAKLLNRANFFAFAACF